MLDSSITSALRVHNTSNVTLWCARIIALLWETFTGWVPAAHRSVTEKKKIQTISTESIMSLNVHRKSISDVFLAQGHFPMRTFYENEIHELTMLPVHIADIVYWLVWFRVYVDMKWHTQTICDICEWNRIFDVKNNVVWDSSPPFPKVSH